MKLKVLLFAFSLLAVFFFNSQNVNAGCTYSNPLFATMTPLDKVDIRECVTFNPESMCDSACGSSIFTECDGTKIKAKDIWACDNPGSARCWIGSNAEVFGYTYTYKDCGGEPINKLCYGGRCVECLSNADCTSPKVCNLDIHTCVSKGCQRCSDNTECGACNANGDFCDGSTGVGILKIKDTINCNLACAKYDVKTGVRQGFGQHLDVAEICYDTPSGTDPATGKPIYSNWMVDEYAGSGMWIKETSCGSDYKCKQTTMACKNTDDMEKEGVDTNKLPKTSNTIPPNTYSYYCNSGGIPPPPPVPPPPSCSTCGSPAVCVGECVPGEPPYKYDSSCNKIADCSSCGCPPSEYQPGSYSACGTTVQSSGSTVKCKPTGTCAYSSPPGATGEVPDCPAFGPEKIEYNRTYIITTLYLLSGNNVGSFSGFNWTGSSWQADNSIRSATSAPSNSAPAIFFNNGDTYMISGSGDGRFFGYNWTASSWSDYPAIANGLTDIGNDSKPSIFYMGGNWNMIAGRASGDFTGFTFTGSSWTSNTSLITGLTDIGDNSAPSVFYKEGTMYLVSGEKTGIFYGFNWTGNSWQNDAGIIAGLAGAAAYSELCL